VKQAQPPGGERVVPLSARELLRGGGEGAVESQANLAVKPQAAAPAGPVPPRAFSSLQDLIALASEKRDIKLKTDLESMIRPIRIAPGQFELALEPGAHPGLANEIGRKLEAFTGMRWIVMVAKEGGAKPVARQRQEAKDSLFIMAREHPDVQAVLKRFPGAEILDVKEPDQNFLAPNVSENDEEPR
jgi:DNA polymerase-3 subunit gamma/tau